jgi:hypothetical protein
LAVDDPALNEWMTPNHYECRSFWSPNYDDTEITGMPSLSKVAQGQKTLSECSHRNDKWVRLFKAISLTDNAKGRD